MSINVTDLQTHGVTGAQVDIGEERGAINWVAEEKWDVRCGCCSEMEICRGVWGNQVEETVISDI